MKPNSILLLSPSFSSYSSGQFAEIAAQVIREIELEEDAVDETDGSEIATCSGSAADSVEIRHDARVQEDEYEDEDEDEFEFAFARRDPDSSPISADDLFSNGQIRPTFPIFNRDLLLEDGGDQTPVRCGASIGLPLRQLLTEARKPVPVSDDSSSESEALETIPAGTYCVWSPRSTAPPTPGRCKKSNSTGSSKRWRFRDLLPRSSSDGKETLVLLSTSATRSRKKEKNASKISKEKSGLSSSFSSSSERRKSVSPHEMHYMTKRAMKEGERHRSFLPYRKDIVGFFASASGLSKIYHPF